MRKHTSRRRPRGPVSSKPVAGLDGSGRLGAASPGFGSRRRRLQGPVRAPDEQPQMIDLRSEIRHPYPFGEVPDGVLTLDVHGQYRVGRFRT
jgi:hypothetical protein